MPDVRLATAADLPGLAAVEASGDRLFDTVFADVEQVVVDPAHGRRGLGAALLDAVCREVASRGGRRVTLRTYADVPWNAPFYARHSFVELMPEPDWMMPLRETEERLCLMRHGRRVAMQRTLASAEAPATRARPV